MKSGNRVLERTGDVLNRALFFCFAAMAAAILWWTVENLIRETAPGWMVLAYLALGGAAAAALVWLGGLGSRCRERTFCLALLLCALLVRCVWAVLVDTRPQSDFGNLYSAAVQLAQGVNVMNDKQYFQWWPYQTGFVAWMALLIRLFGDSVVVLKVSNALCSSLSVVLVYLLARRFASRQGAGGAAQLYLFYPGTWLLTPVLTNQHLSECLLLAALYVYTVPAEGWRKKLPLAAGAGLLLALSNVSRPSAVVAVLAIAAALALRLLEGGGARACGRALAVALLAVAVYAAVGAGLSGLVRVTGLNRGGLGNCVPEWKFVLGLNQETKGRYSAQDAQTVFGSDDPREAARRLIRERLDCPPGELLELMERKSARMWGGFEELVWTFTQNVTDRLEADGVDTDRLFSRCQRGMAGAYAWIFLLTALGGVGAALGPGRRSLGARLLALTALAYFCAHLLIEAQARYRSLMLAAAVPLAALGLDWLRDLARRRAGGRNQSMPQDTENNYDGTV